MTRYMVEFSYIENGERERDFDYAETTTGMDAAAIVIAERKDLDGIRIEGVWENTGKRLEARKFLF